MRVPLSVSASVVLDGSGNGQVQLGPQLAGTSWTPENGGVVVTPVSLTVVSSVKLYNGAPQDQNFIGGSYTGDNNAFSVSVPDMFPGAVLTAVWKGGNPGARATLTITGTQNIPGPAGAV